MPHFCTCAANAAKCEVRGLETPELGKGWAPKQHVFNFGMLPKLGFSKETSKAISLINSIFTGFLIVWPKPFWFSLHLAF